MLISFRDAETVVVYPLPPETGLKNMLLTLQKKVALNETEKFNQTSASFFPFRFYPKIFSAKVETKINLKCFVKLERKSNSFFLTTILYNSSYNLVSFFNVSWCLF